MENLSNYIYYKVWDEILVHSQTSAVPLLKFGHGKVILSHTLLGMWLVIHAEIKVNPWWSKGLPDNK